METILRSQKLLTALAIVAGLILVSFLAAPFVPSAVDWHLMHLFFA